MLPVSKNLENKASHCLINLQILKRIQKTGHIVNRGVAQKKRKNEILKLSVDV